MVFFQLVSMLWMELLTIPYPSFVCCFNKGGTIHKFVFDVCVCMFCFIFVYRLIL